MRWGHYNCYSRQRRQRICFKSHKNIQLGTVYSQNWGARVPEVLCKWKFLDGSGHEVFLYVERGIAAIFCKKKKKKDDAAHSWEVTGFTLSFSWSFITGEASGEQVLDGDAWTLLAPPPIIIFSFGTLGNGCPSITSANSYNPDYSFARKRNYLTEKPLKRLSQNIQFDRDIGFT